jgi:hypothetical protein
VLQIAFERQQGLAVNCHGVQKPTVPVVLVAEVSDQSEMLPQLAKSLSKAAQRIGDGRPFEIAQNLVPINDRIDIPQGGGAERPQIVLVSAGGDGVDDLVEVEIGEDGRGLGGVAVGRRLRSREEDAVKSPRFAGAQ